MQKLALRLKGALPSSGNEYVDNFLAINASLLLCKDPSAVTNIIWYVNNLHQLNNLGRFFQ